MRPSDGQFSVSVQHEVLPRVSVDVSYNRRWFTELLRRGQPARRAGRLHAVDVHGAADDRLPDGGGYPIEVFSITRDAALRGARTYRTFETDFGDARTQDRHGVNVSVNTRLRNGLMFQGGTSTGRGVVDRCDTLPKIDSPDPRGCARDGAVHDLVHAATPSYTVPKVDVMVSAQFRSRNPANIGAAGGGLGVQRRVAECQHAGAEHRRPAAARPSAGHRRWSTATRPSTCSRPASCTRRSA